MLSIRKISTEDRMITKSIIKRTWLHTSIYHYDIVRGGPQIARFLRNRETVFFNVAYHAEPLSSNRY